MTDEEIIKAYERCFTLGFDESTCYECPFYTATAKCTEDLRDSVLNLIMRQKAEINNLKAELSAMRSVANSLKMHMENEKKDAIREFARELKCGVPQETGVIRCKDVDTLVKEMTEGNNENH